jgi:hypothetical protein
LTPRGKALFGMKVFLKVLREYLVSEKIEVLNNLSCLVPINNMFLKL